MRPRLKLALDVVGGERQRQPVGITGDHPPGDVELLQLHPGVAAVLDLSRDVDRPELRRHLALLEPAESVCLGDRVRRSYAATSRGAVFDSRISQGRSLCPSMSGVDRSSFRACSRARSFDWAAAEEAMVMRKSVSGKRDSVSSERE